MTNCACVLRSVLPFNYLFHTRLRSSQDRISWVLIHPLPVLFLAGAVGDNSLFSSLVLGVLGLVAFQALYEIGYIDNDVFTTRREVDPTLRLSPSEASFLRTKFSRIAAARALVFLACLAATEWLLPEGSQGALGAFGLICSVTMLAFLLHNRIRNRWNVLTYGVLATGRYVSVPLLAWGLEEPAILLAAFLMMPLPRALEHASKPKYRFDLLRRVSVPFERFRAVYYLCAIPAYAMTMGVTGAAQQGVLVLGFFATYRCAVLVAVRRGVVLPTVHQSYVKKTNKGDP